jgi:hypothetical protein
MCNVRNARFREALGHEELVEGLRYHYGGAAGA